MNCSNCGAPLELGDGRTVLTCAYCESTRKLVCDSSDGDRIMSLDRPSDLECPRCQQQLVRAALDGRQADYCNGCRGILVKTAIFAEVTRTRRAAYRGPEIPAQPIDPEMLLESVRCPNCHNSMDVHPNYGPGQAVIDSCHQCNLVWLDNSELTTIERTPGCRR